MNVKRVFWILFTLNLLNYIDRQVLYAVFPLVQADLLINDAQLGLLASVFMLVYMFYAPVVGYFAARTPRRYWIGASAILWSVATLACGAVKNYIGLLTARGICGAGEAGFTTLAQPFLAEQTPKEKRATVLALFCLALPIGAALGYMFGGVLGSHFGWRIAFLGVGLPGIVAGILAFKWLREPEQQMALEKPGWRDYQQLLKNKPFLWICLAHAMVTFVMGGISAWMPTYFTRYLGLDVGQAGTIFGGLVVVSGAAGTYIGGKLADWMLRHTKQAYYHIMEMGLAGGLLAGWAGLSTTYTPLSVFCIGIAVACLFMPLGPIAAALVQVTSPAVRSMAFAVNIFLIHILGDALSPVFIGQCSNVWGLKIAFFIALLAAVLGYLFVRFAKQADQ